MAKQLSLYHKKMLIEESGFSRETIEDLDWWSASKVEVAKLLGWKRSSTGGLVIPYPDTDGFVRIRLDEPLKFKDKGKTRVIKYMAPKNSSNHAYVPPSVRPLLANPSMPLYITEGEKKAVKATQDGFPCVGLPGVWGWRTTVTEVTDGYSEPKKRKRKDLLPELAAANWVNRTVFIVFDSDANDNESVRKAGKRLAAVLRQHRANVYFIVLPEDDTDAKMGLDDFLVAHGKEAFKRLIEHKLQEAAHEDRNFDIEEIEKLETSPPIYRVTVFGKTVKMDGPTLANFNRFSVQVMQATNHIPDMDKPGQNWRSYLEDVLTTKLEVVEAPEEADKDEIYWWHVLKYLDMRAVKDESALAEERGVFRDEEYVYFHGPTLHKYLVSRQVRIEPWELWDVLRQKGAVAERKTVTDPEGNKKRVRLWRVSCKAVDETNELEEHIPEDIREELEGIPEDIREELDDYEPW